MDKTTSEDHMLLNAVLAIIMLRGKIKNIPQQNIEMLKLNGRVRMATFLHEFTEIKP